MSTKIAYDTGSPCLDPLVIKDNMNVTITSSQTLDLLKNGLSNLTASGQLSNNGTIYTAPNTNYTFTQNTGYYTSPYAIGNITQTNPVLEVKGDGADISLNGKSLKTFMEKVEERLLILQPDPAKLEKYAALRKAYDHYKLMEKLVAND